MSEIKLNCPICSQDMIKTPGSVRCNNNHSFDIAKQGYINLLPVQNKKSLNPGDTKEMLCARRTFLNQGYYKPICDEIIEQSQNYLGKNDVILDVGCGEGYYLAEIHNKFADARCVGVDISKDGVKMACSRSKDIMWLVATAAVLPLKSESVSLITSVFALVAEEEFARVLKPGGRVVEIISANDHLKELKEVIYDKVYKQDKKPKESKFLKEVLRKEVKFSFTLNNDQLLDLLLMTPHFWRMKKEKKEQLAKVEKMNLTAAFWVRVLEKN